MAIYFRSVPEFLHISAELEGDIALRQLMPHLREAYKATQDMFGHTYGCMVITDRVTSMTGVTKEVWEAGGILRQIKKVLAIHKGEILFVRPDKMMPKIETWADVLTMVNNDHAPNEGRMRFCADTDEAQRWVLKLKSYAGLR